MTKRARTAAERRQLGDEAALLRVLAHPGVIQLLAVEGGELPDGLIFRRVPGGELGQLGSQPLQVIAGLGAAIATTVADLHDVGVQHGAIEASHVLLDEHGRPVLCGFGRAQRHQSHPRADISRRQDVSALARLLLSHLERGAPIGVDRTLRRAAGAARYRRTADARWLARQLVLRVPGARLPDPGGTAGTCPPIPPGAAPSIPPRAAPRRRAYGESRQHGWRSPVRALVLLAGLGVVGLAVLLTSGWSSPSSSPRDRQLACPPVDMGCRPVPTPGGVLTTAWGRYLVGEPDDVVVLGRWQCGSVSLPAVLRPGTGQLWSFGAWPGAGRGLPGRLVASHLRVASSLRVLVGPSGCDRIEVERRGQPPLIEKGAG